MKFIINKQNFLKALSTIEGIISAREIRSSIGNVLIESTSTGIDLTSTDLLMTLKTSVEANIVEPGNVMLPGRMLSQAIRSFRYENIEFTETNEQVKIHDADNKGKTEIEIMSTPADEFQVKISSSNFDFVPLPPTMISEMIDRCVYAVAEDDSRYAFTGLYVENKEGRLIVVGTDGRRLSVVTRAIPEPIKINEGIIIPVKTIRELRKLLTASDQLSIANDADENTILFKLKDSIFISKLVESKYPDYTQVIPKKSEYTIRLNKEDFRLAIKQASVLAAEPSRQIQLSFEKGQVKIQSSTPDVGRVEDTIACSFEGEPFTIAFNSNFLTDVLSVIKSEQVELQVSSSSAPAVIVDTDDADFKAVIMPMRF